jgi:hypothetical protein
MSKYIFFLSSGVLMPLGSARAGRSLVEWLRFEKTFPEGAMLIRVAVHGETDAPQKIMQFRGTQL